MRWSLDDLDFPVLVLREPPTSPALTGLGGGDLHGLVSIGIGYGRRPGTTDPGLMLETLVRRGHRLAPDGGASWVGTGLTDLATHAVRTLLLADLAAQGVPKDQALPERVERLDARARALGEATPSAPWRVTAADVDGTAYALWLAELEEGFAAVLDCGAVVLTASGTAAPADWRLVALSPDAVRAVLGLSPWAGPPPTGPAPDPAPDPAAGPTADPAAAG